MVDSIDKNIRTKSKAGASESNQSGYKNSSAGHNIHRYFTELHKIEKKNAAGNAAKNLPSEEIRSVKFQICNSQKAPWQ